VAPSVVSDPRVRGMSTERTEGDDEPFDDERQLCPDGGCVGLIGPDGHCKVCGKEAAAPADRPAAAAVAARAAAPVPAPAQRQDADETASPAARHDDADDDEARQLCPDGSCIGLIGPDGRCKVCGTQADSAHP
jgi:hypothetical protein